MSIDRHPLLRKLLETASHPTATDGERLSALNAFRRVSQKGGDVDALFPNAQTQELELQLQSIRMQLVSLKLENKRLRHERDKLLLAADANRANEQVVHSSAVSKHDESIIYGVLSADWAELHRIHVEAKISGYKGTSTATMQHLSASCYSKKASRREPGSYPDLNDRMRWYAQSWRRGP